MTQAQRDRLVTLKKANKYLITRREAAEELGVTVRQVRRLLKGMKERGDKVVIHAARGRPSPRKIAEATEQKVVGILSEAAYRGFRPTLAMEYLRDKHQIAVSKETVRQWMMRGQLWRGKKEKIQQVHVWRPRRSRCGELVQWDTSEHDWLEERGEKIYLIAMIDDATSRLYARFVARDSTAENLRVLWGYVELYGRPVAFYTDKASLFQTAEKRRRDEPGVDQDPAEMPPTQIGRALGELGVNWIAAHSPQAKGRVERGFGTAQDRLVKGLRVAGACTREAANRYLETEFLPWWNRTLTVLPAHVDDAHRRLGKEHNLAATLSHVEQRQVSTDYTVRYQGKLYRIERKDVRVGLRGSRVRVEQRLDGSMAMRFENRYLHVQECEPPRLAPPAPKPAAAKPRKGPNAGGKSQWMEGFWGRRSPTLQQAIAIANATN
jgi:transposase